MTINGDFANVLGMFVGFVLTLLVFSYLLGDNGLFRFALHVFIGVTAGYVVAVAIETVIWPRLLSPVLFGLPVERLFGLIPLALSMLLLAKLFPRLSALGSPVMALLAGIGAATAIGGALLGTLFPQAIATVDVFDAGSGRPFLNGLIVLLGAIASLAYFQFHVRTSRPNWMTILARIGQILIAIALGVVFAGVYMAALTAMVERISALVDFIRWFFNPAA